MKKNFLDGAFSIGSRLVREAIWLDDKCSWMGLDAEPTASGIRIFGKPVSGDLYGGTAGIALALAHLHSETSDDQFRRAALGSIRHALERCARGNGNALSVYSGKLGVAYSCIVVGELCKDEDIIRRGLTLIRECLQTNHSESEIDIIAGAAGAIPVLLWAARQYDVKEAAAAAVGCGDFLLSHGVESEDGLSWNAIPGCSHNLTGYAHGCAGIGCALANLFATTSDSRFKIAAMQAFEYERAFFDSNEQNWPDFRVEPVQGKLAFGMAWCHGAPGIAISRIAAARDLESSLLAMEAGLALETTRNNLRRWMESGSANASLCHGLAGNADILLLAGSHMRNSCYTECAQEVGNWLIDKFSKTRGPWPSGYANGEESPSLMLGYTGTMHFFLRLHNTSIPSVLSIGLL